MLSTTTRPLFNSQFTHFTPRHPLLRRHSLSTTTTTTTTTQIKMSSSSSSSPSTIEHIVLFKVKPTSTPTQLSSMLTSLNSLTTLPNVLHLTAGKLRQSRSPIFSFTHILHSRYATKQDLANYSSHPDHLSAVRTNVLPICDDIMAVDWVNENLNGPIVVKPGSAIRLQLIKLKDGVGEREKRDVFEVLNGLKEKLGGILQVSFGENFSPARSKGFEICSIGVFAGVHDLDALEGNLEIVKEKDKVRDFIDDLIVVDYVVPSFVQSASL